MKQQTSSIELVVKLLFWGYLLWEWGRLVAGAEFIFVDNFNLAIHEAGHVFMFWGGRLLSFWGGTLFQLLIPLVILGYFVVERREPFSSGICGWWVGENLVNVGIYMADAVVKRLPLVGGGEHDWAYILGRSRLLEQAEFLGGGVRWMGLSIMLVALLWMIYTLWRQWSDSDAG